MTREELIAEGKAVANVYRCIGEFPTGAEILDQCVDQIEADGKLIEELRAALRDIAKQKRTDELVTSVDVEYADFEQGYDDCIDCARAVLAARQDQKGINDE